MTKQDKLKAMLTNRNPLLDTKREAVTPVDLYTKPQVDNGIKVDKTTSGQVNQPTKPLKAKTTKPLVVKYTTHLLPGTIKELKRYAFENELKDYQVLQEAVAKYLKAKKKP